MQSEPRNLPKKNARLDRPWLCGFLKVVGMGCAWAGGAELEA